VIERLGSTCEIPVNARVIAATHDRLETLVQKGSFREDLYYRLNVLQIVMPSLRERTTDIELLARDIFKRFSNENRSNSRGFSQKSLRAIAHHPWPGNVRELINRIRRAMVMSEGQLISPADLGLEEDSQSQSFTTLEESRMEATRRAIASTLQHTHNNISRASRELGVSRTTLYRMIDKFSINI
jgi:DNA-binding NtrC family response regulator